MSGDLLVWHSRSNECQQNERTLQPCTLTFWEIHLLFWLDLDKKTTCWCFFQFLCLAKLTSCWLQLYIYPSDIRVVSTLLSNSRQESEKASFPKCQTIPLMLFLSVCEFDGETPTNWVSLHVQKSLTVKKCPTSSLQLSPSCVLYKEAL